MSRKQVITLAAVGVGIALLIVWGLLARQGAIPGLPGAGEKEEAATSTPSPLDETGYMSEVPADAVITPPAIEAPVSPGSAASAKIFSVSISRNSYEPSTITVNRGDNVDLRLTATDGDYDWSLPAVGYYQAMKRGEMKRVVFDAALAGTFRFECRDFCPAGKTISGQLIVLP